ncbi:MAG: type IX secretion system sortase PorU [Candidatus Zixiibacteriota bacterium]
MENSSDQSISFVVHNSTDLGGLVRAQNTDSSTTYIRIIQIGIPFGSSVRILRAEGRMLEPVAVSMSSGATRLSNLEPLVSLLPPLTVRGRQIVTVRIAPMYGDAVYREVAVDLAFERPGALPEGVPQVDPQFDRIFKSVLINYDQFRNWPVPERDAAKLAPSAGPFTATGTWYKLIVNQTGLCRITGSQLQSAGLSLANLRSDSIRLFNGGGLPVEMRNERPRPTFDEIAITVDDGGDGLFGIGDQITFFAEGANRWLYYADSLPRWNNNPYDSKNVYWLATSGSFTGASIRMGSIDGTPTTGGDPTYSNYRRYQHVEQDNLLLVDGDGHINNYYLWYWTDSTRLSFFVDGTGIQVGDTALITLDGRTGSPYMSLRVNSTLAQAFNLNGLNCQFTSQALVDGLNSISVNLSPNSSTYKPYFNFLEMSYRSRLEPQNDRLDFAMLGYDGTGNLAIQDNFSAIPLVFLVDDPRRPIQITGATHVGGTLTFSAQLALTAVNRFYVATASTAAAPLSITRVSPTDMYADLSQTDLFVIAPRSLTAAMSDYVDYRRGGGRSVKTVALEDIFDNFSFGLTDPTAVRDYLKYAYQSFPSPAPSAVLLVGDANFDYLDRLRTGQANLMPSYINPIENVSLGNSYGDDNYVFFGVYGLLDSDTSYLRADRGYDMMIARWPVKNAAEIGVMTQKIKQYESPSDLGFWRDDITLVADDEFGNFNNETFHTTQTEDLSRAHIPALLTRQKIYLWDYPFVNRFKPAVNDAIVKAINDGTLLVNYVGHGNPDVWAHERVFTRTGDLPRLHNTHLPLVFAASCAIGFFDDPAREAMGEDLLGMSTGGAIGVISAMRLVFSSDNSQFNRQVFDLLLYNDSLTIGEAMYGAKLIRQYAGGFPNPIQNDRSYVYFGDPYLRLGLPRLKVEFTQTPDSLMALGRTVVTGRVVDAGGGTVPRDGQLSVEVFDSDRTKVHRLLNSNGSVQQEVSYSLTGPTIFRGTASIQAGQFQFAFMSPLDIGYGGVGARITVYGVLDSIDAAGLVDSLPVASTIATTTDSTGPTIRYTVGTRANLVDGTEVTPDEHLKITLSDSSGINLSGALGHGITLEIDNRPENAVNVTDLFSFDIGDYVTGSLDYGLADLAAGEHSFKLKAWDNANNSSTAEFSLKVVSTSTLAIQELLNVPNPMRERTTFYFELTRPVRQFDLDIFTLSGRKIRTYSAYDLGADNYPNGQTTFDWDGRDADGDRVATGVYIYRATAMPLQDGDTVESFGKVVVVN